MAKWGRGEEDWWHGAGTASESYIVLCGEGREACVSSPSHFTFSNSDGESKKAGCRIRQTQTVSQSLAVNSAAFSRVFFALLGAGVCRSVKKRGVARCLSSLDGSELILSHLQLRTRFGRVGILFPPPLHLLFCEYSCFYSFYSVLIFGRADIFRHLHLSGEWMRLLGKLCDSCAGGEKRCF